MPDQPTRKARPRTGRSMGNVFEPPPLPEHMQMPQTPDMERAVIAGLLTDPTHLVPAAIEELSSENAFYNPAYRAVFKVVIGLFRADKLESIDIFTVAEQLRIENKLDLVGGEIGLAEIQNSIATVANFDAWLKAVRECEIRRNMIRTCQESIFRCSSLTDHHAQPLSVDQVLDLIEGDVLNVRSQNQRLSFMPFDELTDLTYARINDVIEGRVERGIPTGFADLDRKIQGGVKNGEMFVLAARPSIGKTSFALNLVRNMLVHGKSVAFFSLEMTAEQVTRRLLCTEAKVSEMDLVKDAPRKEALMSQLQRAIGVLRKWPLYIDETSELRVMELKAKARRLQKDHHIDAVIIDYLQLMRGSGNQESRQQDVAEISAGIKSLAKELKIPVIALAQLSRETEKNATSSSRPKLSHLRESGAIEQDADIVAFLHRDRDKQKTVSDSDRSKGLDAELIVEKNRNGEIGIINLTFFPWFTLFTSVAKHRYDASES